MKAYELLYFVAPSIDEESRLAVMKRIETALAEGNGVVDNVDNWGKRKLAYEINGLTDGDYTLIDFHAEPSNIAELDRRTPHLRCCCTSHDRCPHRSRLIFKEIKRWTD